MARFVLEGEWTGYSSSQQSVKHREVIDQKRADRLKNLHAIVYTDGTSLLISLRPALRNEKIRELNQYGALIRQAEATGKSRVLVAELSDDDD